MTGNVCDMNDSPCDIRGIDTHQNKSSGIDTGYDYPYIVAIVFDGIFLASIRET